MTSADITALLKPFDDGSRHLRNRIVMAPMTRRFSPGGVPGPDVAAYYARRASSVGLIITEGVLIDHPSAGSDPDVPHLYGDRALAGWRQVTDAVHEAGGRIAAQLWHVGLARDPEGPLYPGYPALSPSGIDGAGRPAGTAATSEQLAGIRDAYARSAAAARDAGFDGVEVHGAHGYFLDLFLWEATNRRDDEFGGSLEARVRYPASVVAAVRDAVGPDFPIIFRFSQWKNGFWDAQIARTPEELGRFLGLLAQAGVDAFHPSTRRFWLPGFEGSDLTLAGWTRRLSGLPTIAVGGVGVPPRPEDPGTVLPENVPPTERVADAAAAIGAGEFDLMAVGRALLTDPDWVTELQEDRIGEMTAYRKPDEDYLDGAARGGAIG